MAKQFSDSFFLKSPTEVAKRLLGAKISTTINGKTTSGVIVEVEAYGGPKDMACHAFRGPSKRNQVMFWDGGHCYVYLIYGLHYCVNVVTETSGTGSAVLIRAIEPLEGHELMIKRRKQRKLAPATSNGPAKLCQALGIDLKFLGHHFSASPKIRLEPYRKVAPSDLGVSKRIGITKSAELPWRFYVRRNQFVGRPAK